MDQQYRFNKATFLILSILWCVISASKMGAAVAKAPEEQAFLSPEEAFVLNIGSITRQAHEALVQFNILPGYQLYQEHLEFRTLGGEAISQETLKLPEAHIKKDPALGTYKVYQGRVTFTVPLEGSPEGRGLKVQYQGCAEEGFCYPPIFKKVFFSETGVATVTDLSPQQFNTRQTVPMDEGKVVEDTTTASVLKKALLEAESGHLASLLAHSNILVTLLAFLGLGVLLAFTPCVLPMVPILANILVGQEQPLSRKRSFVLSGVYVFSVALCYAVAGLTAGLLGSHLSTTLQQPLFLIALSFLILLFALSQFNIIHVQLPQFLTQTLKKLEMKHHKEGSVVGAASMGIVSALMVSPCVTPALVGALTYIGQTGDALLGGLALFALAIGMGLPLLVAACIGSHFLPKAGSWMVYIKNATGLLLLLLASSILMRVVPNRQASDNVLADMRSSFTVIHTPSELSQAIRSARASQKPVILDVYADWCVSCKQMDREVFEDQAVQNTLSRVELLRLDLTQQTKGKKQLQEELGIIGPPMVLFFWPNGQEAKTYRLAGKPKSNNFIERVTHFLEKAREHRP